MTARLQFDSREKSIYLTVIFFPTKQQRNELITCLKSLMILSDLANRLTKMIFKETVDRVNR